MYNEIKEFISNSDYFSTPKCSLEDLFQPWKEAKSEYLLPLFNDKLIITKEVEVDSSKENETKIARLYDEYYCPLFKHIYLKSDSWSCLNWRDFFDNQLRDSFTVYLPEGGTKTYKAGMKAMRFLAKVIEDLGLKDELGGKVEEFRLKHSQILNTKHTKYKLNLSIHPLDYITMSDNCEGWGSCMSWDEGEYHLGTVEMMNSSSVVVAYIASEHNDYCGWNSKIWRKLYIVTPDFVCGIKGYPYEITNIDQEVFKMIAEMRPNHYDLANQKHLCENMIDCGTQSFYFETNYMYNDFGSLYSRNIPMMFAEGFDMDNLPRHFNYSGLAQCMYCGETEQTVEGFVSHSRFCGPCDDRKYCSHCDTYVYGDNLIEYDGEVYCTECFYEYYQWDHAVEHLSEERFEAYRMVWDRPYEADLFDETYTENTAFEFYFPNQGWYKLSLEFVQKLCKIYDINNTDDINYGMVQNIIHDYCN